MGLFAVFHLHWAILAYTPFSRCYDPSSKFKPSYSIRNVLQLVFSLTMVTYLFVLGFGSVARIFSVILAILLPCYIGLF